MELWEKIKEWIDYNRWIVIALFVSILVWIGAISCEPVVLSPTDPQKLVTAPELELEFTAWQNHVDLMNKKFDIAAQDLQDQQEKMNQLEKLIIDVATGAIPASFASLAQVLISGGLIGFAADNIRKRGLIAGLKRNRSPT